MIELKYGNTNTFFIRGSASSCGLLIDTDYAGSLSAFYKALKLSDVKLKGIEYVLATHYHPDHMGLISELMKQGVKLLLVDVQKDFVHFSDAIFSRDFSGTSSKNYPKSAFSGGTAYTPIDETLATVITCEESRNFLAGMGISGELIHTPSHSEDSVSLILDDGDCFVGDLEPYEYIEAYEENPALTRDWENIMALKPKRIFFAHRPAKTIAYCDVDCSGCPM